MPVNLARTEGRDAVYCKFQSNSPLADQSQPLCGQQKALAKITIPSLCGALVMHHILYSFPMRASEAVTESAAAVTGGRDVEVRSCLNLFPRSAKSPPL